MYDVYSISSKQKPLFIYYFEVSSNMIIKTATSRINSELAWIAADLILLLVVSILQLLRRIENPLGAL